MIPETDQHKLDQLESVVESLRMQVEAMYTQPVREADKANLVVDLKHIRNVADDYIAYLGGTEQLYKKVK